MAIANEKRVWGSVRGIGDRYKRATRPVLPYCTHNHGFLENRLPKDTFRASNAAISQSEGKLESWFNLPDAPTI